MSKEKILVMKSGERLAITGEEGKYWLCGEQRFRKLSASVLTVEEAEVVETDTPVKKTSRKKKKPAEEEAKEGE